METSDTSRCSSSTVHARRAKHRRLPDHEHAFAPLLFIVDRDDRIALCAAGPSTQSEGARDSVARARPNASAHPSLRTRAGRALAVNAVDEWTIRATRRVTRRGLHERGAIATKRFALKRRS